MAKLQGLKQEKRDLENHMSLVKILPPSKTDRHWVIPKGNRHLGWLPYSNEAKLLDCSPYTETVNFAMTVKNILVYADEIGWTQDHQIEICMLN